MRRHAFPLSVLLLALLFYETVAQAVEPSQEYVQANGLVQSQVELLLENGNQADVSLREEVLEVNRRNQILEAKSQIEDKAYSRFESLMAGLGVLITLLVLGFGIFTHRAAVAAARQEMADAKDKVRALHEEAAAANAEAAKAAIAANDSANAAMAAAESAKGAAEGALAHQQVAREASEKVTAAAALADQLNLPQGEGQGELSDTERETVSSAAKELDEKPQHEWSGSEFRVKILQAFDSRDWDEMLRLARGLEFVHSTDPALVAFALYQQGHAQKQKGLLDLARSAFDELVVRFGDTTDPSVKRLVDAALVSKAIILGETGEEAKAIVAADDLLMRVGGSTKDEYQVFVAKALVAKGVSLCRIERIAEGIHVFDEVIHNYKNSTDERLIREAVLALLNKGDFLEDHDKKIAVFDEILLKYSLSTDITLIGYVALSMFLKAAELGKAGDRPGEISMYNETIERFRTVESPHTSEAVDRATIFKVLALRANGEIEESLRLGDAVISEMGSVDERDRRNQITRLYFNKAAILGQLGKVRPCVAALEIWTSRLGKTDCDMIVQEAAFDPVRSKALFVKYLSKHGCQLKSDKKESALTGRRQSR